MTPAILWHRACEILHIPSSKRVNGWPDSLNIEQIARLHFHADKEMETALLSLMRTAIETGSLESNDADFIPGDEDYHYILQRMGGKSMFPVTRDRYIPIVSRESYHQWSDRPPIPEDSPLLGWVKESGESSTNKQDDAIQDGGRDPGEPKDLFGKRLKHLKDWLESSDIPPEDWRYGLGKHGLTVNEIRLSLAKFSVFRTHGTGDPIARKTFERDFWKKQDIAGMRPPSKVKTLC